MSGVRETLGSLRAIAAEAGVAVMAVYGRACEVEAKADASPLTEADLAADRVIRAGLEAAFPGVFIMSEESRSAELPDTGTFFLVDPIDGTKEFINRNGEFTVNIALIRDGVAVAGVVDAPALGLSYFGALGLGAWMSNGGQIRPLQVATPAPSAPLRIIGSRSHAHASLAQWLSTLACPYTFVAAGSSLKFCRLAEGAADVYPRFAPTSQWDTAAAQCILETAGGAVLGPDGEPLRYGRSLPILNPHFIASGCRSVRARLAVPKLC